MILNTAAVSEDDLQDAHLRALQKGMTTTRGMIRRAAKFIALERWRVEAKRQRILRDRRRQVRQRPRKPHPALDDRDEVAAVMRVMDAVLTDKQRRAVLARAADEPMTNAMQQHVSTAKRMIQAALRTGVETAIAAA